jgi:Mg2+-importing ATPase
MRSTVRPHRLPSVPHGARSDDALLDQAGADAAVQLWELARCTPAEALARLDSDERGLSEIEAALRLAECGINRLPTSVSPSWLARLSASIRSPFIALLLALDVVVAMTGDALGVVLITSVVSASLTLRLRQEARFDQLVASLQNLAAHRVGVLRRQGHGNRGRPVLRDRNPRLLVPGDLIELEIGDVVPADCRIYAAHDFALDQAVLIGESMPVPKYATDPGVGPVWMGPTGGGSVRRLDVLRAPTLCLTGSSVASGHATVMVAKTGENTILAAVTRKLTGPRRPTAADLGLRSVTWLLIRLLCALVPAVFVLTRLVRRDTDLAGAALFAIAAAVGLVPELLPVVLAAAHGRGLSALAKVRIIVTRPAAVQDLAAMDVLCTDKTGTLTAGTPALVRWIGPDGGACPAVLDHSVLHAVFTTERHNRLDAAILDATDPLDHEVARAQYDRAAELGFDYTRRRASVLLDSGTGDFVMITKGAVAAVLSCCTHLRVDGHDQPLDEASQGRLATVCASLWADGLRLLAVAYRGIEATANREPDIGWETGLTLIGFLAFTDPPKPGLAAAVHALAEQGVRTVIVTGDAVDVAAAVCTAAGIAPGQPVAGASIDRLGEAELARIVTTTTVFAETDPLQKARVVRALRRAGHVVGYLGDGVNDTPALRAADIGLAVPEAVGVARYAADAIMLDKDLAVLQQGITTARHAALNATKYLKATLSANLGNVLSVLAASAFLPFLPMLPLQILVQNLAYDLAQLTLPLDNVDPEQVRRPHRWNSRDLLRFAGFFAPLSSAFDLATFWLLWLFWSRVGGTQAVFHTGWFVEGLLTQVLAVLVIRTGRVPLLGSRPALPVALAAMAGASLALALPHTTWGAGLGLQPLPAPLLGLLLLVVTGYLGTLQTAKVVYQRLTGRWL